MIVPPDEVILMHRQLMELQDQIFKLKSEMQNKCDHDLVSECKDNPIIQRICEICGLYEWQHNQAHFKKLTSSRVKLVSDSAMVQLRITLPHHKFLTSNELPVKEIIE